MRLTRIFVDRDLPPGSSVELPHEAAVHLVKVLRARQGDALILFNGAGCDYAGEIEQLRGLRITVAVGAPHPVDRESPFAVTLIQGIARGDRMDLIVQKATELGASRIAPVLTQRSVVRLDERQAAAKQQHWRAVAAAACEQSGRARLPLIDPPRPLLQYLGGLSNAQGGPARWVLDPEACAPDQIQDRSPGTRMQLQSAELAVGPEGGFTEQELEAFELVKFVPVSLGPRILRTETAALAAMVWAQCAYGDMQGLYPAPVRL